MHKLKLPVMPMVGTEHEYIELSWHLGGYDDSDDRIEQKLVQRGWVVVEGKHYCSAGHAK